MFVVHKISDQLTVTPQQSQAFEKHVVHLTFQKYLFKFSQLGYCISILNVDFLRNVIVRQTANIIVQILVEAMFIELKQGGYIEGIVIGMDQSSIKVQFTGCLIGIIQEVDLHEGSTFQEESKKWVLPISETKGYLWTIGSKVRAKILRLKEIKEETKIQNIIRLRANQTGLGPVEWWI